MEHWLSALALPMTVGLVLLLRGQAMRLRLVDVPSERKQHHGLVPLVGGLAMMGGVLLTVFATGLAVSNVALLTALLVLAIVGYLDDRFDLRPALRFFVQAMAALIMVYWGDVRLENLGNLFGFGDVLLGHWSVPMTVFAVLGVISAMNMIDGADGLAGGLALIALLSFCGFAASNDFLGTTILLPLVFAVAGFMLFNARSPWRRRASVFMGEVGSVMLGFSLAWYAIDLTHAREVFTPITAVWILAVPLMDTIGLMVRRVLKGRSPFAADNEHLHHILQRAGYNQSQTVMIVWGISMLLALIGIASWKLGVPEYVMFYSFMALFALYLYGVMHAWKFMKVMRKVHDGLEERVTQLRRKA